MPPRTIIEERLVAARIDQASNFYPRLSEVWDAILWRLARDPQCGIKQPGPDDWYALKTVAWKAGNVPSIMVLYQLRGDIITLRSSRIEEPAD